MNMGWSNDWLQGLSEAGRAVLVTVAAARGSTPREVGARMLIAPGAVAGSVGGGNLEFRAAEIARQWLAAQVPDARGELQRFPLGARLGQCCGGVADLLFETVHASEPWVEALSAARAAREEVVLLSSFGAAATPARMLVRGAETVGTLGDAALDAQACARARAMLAEGGEAQLDALSGPGGEELRLFVQVLRPSPFQIVLFGAGHVARALVPLLGNLPCEVTWVDARAEAFPAAVPANVRIALTRAPEREVDAAAPGSFFLVMTHSHPLDLDLTERILRRDDFAYCGLIGSLAKRAKFDKRLRQCALPEGALARLVCPIGIAGVGGKRPGEIAVAVAAQLLFEYGRATEDRIAPPAGVADTGAQ